MLFMKKLIRTCDIHGRQTQKGNRCGFYKSGFAIRKKENTDAEAWDNALKNAQELTKKWLKLRAKVDHLEVRLPTRHAGAMNCLQVIVVLPAASWVQII